MGDGAHPLNLINTVINKNYNFIYIHSYCVYTFFCFRLFSLNIVFMRFTHIVVCGYIVHSLYCVEYSIWRILFIRDNSWWLFVYFLVWCYDKYCCFHHPNTCFLVKRLNFWVTRLGMFSRTKHFPKVVALIYTPTDSVRGILDSTSSPNVVNVPFII